ncbi:hypothetical protein [Legionella shakespearei]|uniref:Substrate of the Dot/Icm secretion system n=1 Tax=Legionella shakespearei DSM 23087 TaxID=1122169 RepID=A0A0W0YLX3_9GAMM|nr:hypothetical protein [Legionella shakespearei]KTD57898.1 hypothetical protein Lsha_2176 [Legionella shakespearei DSM 23087]
MSNKKNLLNNYRTIAAFINSRGVAPTSNDDINNFAYRTLLLNLRKQYDDACATGLQTEEYLKFIKGLSLELSVIKAGGQPINNKAIEPIIRLDIIRFLSIVIYNAIRSIVNGDSAEKEHEEAIHTAQMQIEQSIKSHYDPTFYLPTPFSLAHIRQEYNEAYEEDYGSGCIGFFKLPIKRFFQQKSREDELKFLEQVEEYCQNNSSLTEDLVKQLKQSAANLVLLSISSETFGKGSQLGKILQTRLRQTGKLTGLDSIMDNFVEECGTRGIAIPEHLAQKRPCITATA